MTTAQIRALNSHRRRLKERGLSRIEVQARPDDAELLRALAGRLREGAPADELRQGLKELLATTRPSLKALLAAAPLEGLELERSRDLPRDVEL